MIRWALALTFVSAFTLTAAAAGGNVASGRSCSTRANVLKHLASRYSESPVAVGLAANGGVIEVLTSNAGGTWTIIITMPDGTSCMVAAGEAWEQLPKVVAKGPRI